MNRVFLITGRPGVGKTTVVRKVAASLTGRRLAGFYTDEIRAAGVRVGFRLTTFEGRQAVMAHRDVPGRHRVGRYGVDVAVVDALAAATLTVRDDVDVYLVDEIGKMECLARTFVEAMRGLLDSPKRVVATVAERGEGFIAEVKRRPDAELAEVTRANRDAMPDRILAWLAGPERGVRRRGL